MACRRGTSCPPLGQFRGSSAGLSAAVITRLTETWQVDQRTFAGRNMSQVDYVYVWADGIHVNIRLEEHKLCLLVMIGVRADGRKELIALADGYRESAESWADLLGDCARRGMRAPVLAAGDGALGFWGALREVFPETREQRCWFHKTANVLAALPKSAHPGAKKALADIWGAEDKDHARAAAKAFEAAYGAKFPKAAAKVTDDLDQLLAFCDFPGRALGASAFDNCSSASVPTARFARLSAGAVDAASCIPARATMAPAAMAVPAGGATPSPLTRRMTSCWSAMIPTSSSFMVNLFEGRCIDVTVGVGGSGADPSQAKLGGCVPAPLAAVAAEVAELAQRDQARGEQSSALAFTDHSSVPGCGSRAPVEYTHWGTGRTTSGLERPPAGAAGQADQRSRPAAGRATALRASQATLRYPHHSSRPPGSAAHTNQGAHETRDAPLP